MKLPNDIVKQSTTAPPTEIGTTFAADVIKRKKQLVLVMRETTTSYTVGCLITDERHNTLRDALLTLCSNLIPLKNIQTTIRVDPAPGFATLHNDSLLNNYNISLEIGRIKNVNKNPVADKAIQELEHEFLRQLPSGEQLTDVTLAISLNRLNSRIRSNGTSSHEQWTQRDQYTHKQLPINDRELLTDRHKQRTTNHKYSEHSKNKSHRKHSTPIVRVGDLVYLNIDNDKHSTRNRYLVTKTEDEWCYVLKFCGNQLRSKPYKVKCSECYLVPSDVKDYYLPLNNDSDSDDLDTFYDSTPQPQIPVPQVDTPNELNEQPNVIETDNATSRPARNHQLPFHLKDYNVNIPSKKKK